MTNLLKNRFVRMLLIGETILLRFWFALASFGFSLWIYFDETYIINHHVASEMTAPGAQVILFFLHGCATLYGALTGRFSQILLILEGLLGVFLWVGIGGAEMVQQGIPGPMLVAGGGIALFLLMRYPTHYTGDK